MSRRVCGGSDDQSLPVMMSSGRERACPRGFEKSNIVEQDFGLFQNKSPRDSERLEQGTKSQKVQKFRNWTKTSKSVS